MPVTSSSSSVKRWPTREAVLDGLRAWAAAEARRHPELKALGYFGSYARGDEGFGSDLDLVAVVAPSPLPFIERARDWKTETLPVPADLLVYTAEEWEAVRDGAGRFTRVLATETVWLIGDWAGSERSGPDPITRGIHAFMARDWQRARDAKGCLLGRAGPTARSSRSAADCRRVATAGADATSGLAGRRQPRR